MKRITLTLLLFIAFIGAQATIHVIQVWDGYFQFIPTQITIQLGDTIQWLPLDQPMMTHTITSSNIPAGAMEFDQIWEAPADTFFQYVPTIAGVYDYVCTPHEISYNMVGSFTVEAASGIEEKTAGYISIYPNPAQNTLNVKNVELGTPYTIIDVNGKTVLHGFIEKQIDISSLQSGIYFLELIADERRLIKVIKE